MNVAKEMKKTYVNPTKEDRNLKLVVEMTAEEKKASEDRIKAYLNEKLTYFYNNGGPIMDIQTELKSK